jgi:hypothetical protein
MSITFKHTIVYPPPNFQGIRMKAAMKWTYDNSMLVSTLPSAVAQSPAKCNSSKARKPHRLVSTQLQLFQTILN